jgi:tRNA 2-thiouridine synthesizing protein B
VGMLHIVNKSPFERNTLDSCVRLAGDGASLLLIEDGVYGAVNGNATAQDLKNKLGNIKLYVLGPDLKARGMAEDQLIDGVSVVDYGGFVDLVTEHDKVQSWL